MIGIRGALKILQVATDARRARQVVVVVDVAVHALPRRHRVGVGQGKSNRVVIERRAQPAISAVASVAGGRKLGAHVIWVRSGRVVLGVAGIALDGHGLELAIGRTLVAGIAVHRSVRARQRESVIVLLNLLHRHLPAEHRMALLAVGSQLPPVNVGVAVLAALPDVREHGLNVALDASDGAVHPAQRIARPVVIELRNRADRFPSARRMTVLTGDVQVAVRTVRARGLRVGDSQARGKRQQQNRNEFKPAPKCPHDPPLAFILTTLEKHQREF